MGNRISSERERFFGEAVKAIEIVLDFGGQEDINALMLNLRAYQHIVERRQTLFDVKRSNLDIKSEIDQLERRMRTVEKTVQEAENAVQEKERSVMTPKRRLKIIKSPKA